MICEYFKEKYNSSFVFVTHYPSAKRPFYVMDDKEDNGYTLSFDLLYDGIEITTGGQRIHNYLEQVVKIKERDMNVDEYDSYLSLHKHGVPPHGGLGIGLERLVNENIRINECQRGKLVPKGYNKSYSIDAV